MRLDVELARRPATALYQQVADTLINEIRRGRLAPGSLLPGARSLAAELNVTRKVVTTALDDLAAQGWLTCKERKGTFVSETLPLHHFADANPTAAESDDAPGEKPLLVSFDDGAPDPQLSPLNQLGSAYRKALLMLAKSRRGYGDPRGDAVLRELLSSFVNQARGLVTAPDRALITRGSQMALYLACKVLVPHHGHIAVEDPGYRPAWDAFALAGARALPVSVDAGGLRVDKLDALLREHRVHAVYVTPHHQYPTTVTLAPERRPALLALARRFNFTIIEDDYDCEYYFAPGPSLPLCAEDGFENVVYIGSFSKLLLPGIRLGYLFAQDAVLQRATQVRSALDRVGDPALERAVASLLEEGELQRHVRKSRRVYAERRAFFAKRLREDPVLAAAIDFEVPQSGLALWLRPRDIADTEAWSKEAKRVGLGVAPGSAYSAAAEPVAGFRAGYASLDTASLDLAVSLLQRAWLRLGSTFTRGG